MYISAINSSANFKGEPMVIGNMKMNKGPREARQLVSEINEGVRKMDTPTLLVGMAPTSLAFYHVSGLKYPSVVLGAQDAELDGEIKGNAVTGAVSQKMFQDEGAEFIIIGHSERRTKFGETDERVNLKVQSAINNGLTPVVCVGESLSERENGLADKIIKHQVLSALKNVDNIDASNIVIAYEPLWAINTGKSCEPEEAQRVCSMIREIISEKYDFLTAEDVTILYGGSVKNTNAAAYFSQKDIDGALVGGACLDSSNFLGIVKSLKDNKEPGLNGKYFIQ